MDMDTDALRWFQQVADGTTVTEVSELEGVTQSGGSRALARLEGEGGTPLLQRWGRILRMTHAGARAGRAGLPALARHLARPVSGAQLPGQPSAGPVRADPGPGRTALRRAGRRSGRPGDRHPPPARPGVADPAAGPG